MVMVTAMVMVMAMGMRASKGCVFSVQRSEKSENSEYAEDSETMVLAIPF